MRTARRIRRENCVSCVRCVRYARAHTYRHIARGFVRKHSRMLEEASLVMDVKRMRPGPFFILHASPARASARAAIHSARGNGNGIVSAARALIVFRRCKWAGRQIYTAAMCLEIPQRRAVDGVVAPSIFLARLRIADRLSRRIVASFAGEFSF